MSVIFVANLCELNRLGITNGCEGTEQPTMDRNEQPENHPRLRRGPQTTRTNKNSSHHLSPNNALSSITQPQTLQVPGSNTYKYIQRPRSPKNHSARLPEGIVTSALLFFSYFLLALLLYVLAVKSLI